jgi:hypothetical protein
MEKTFKILGLCLGGALVVSFLYSFNMESESHYGLASTEQEAFVIKEKVKHIDTPDPLKAIYMTQCVASRKDLRENIVKFIEDTEVNSIVIDIKDYTGTVAFDTGIREVDEIGGKGSGCRAPDMKGFVEYLHSKNIYVIGRVTVFQDPLYTKFKPEHAVKRKSDGGVWKDGKGLAFIDVGARGAWDYPLSIAKASYDIGFDEINFDYIRFPSDGNMKDIDFTHTGSSPAGESKREMLRQFFEYLDKNLADTKMVTSADIFGMTTTNTDDLGIGQVLENALLYFDYVAPMVYPSHYPSKFNGWPDPNKVPYEIIKFSMDSAVVRAELLKREVVAKMYTTTASSTEKIKTATYNERIEKRLGKKQLRPWLQDFDYPVKYTPEMVRAQIQATYDTGLTSWMMWDPANTYTRSAYLE